MASQITILCQTIAKELVTFLCLPKKSKSLTNGGLWIENVPIMALREDKECDGSRLSCYC